MHFSFRKLVRNQILLDYLGWWRNQSCEIYVFQSVHSCVFDKGSNFAIFSANRRWSLQLLYYRTTFMLYSYASRNKCVSNMFFELSSDSSGLQSPRAVIWVPHHGSSMTCFGSKHKSAFLKSVRWRTGSQWKSFLSTGRVGSNFLLFEISLVTVLSTDCSLPILVLVAP